MSRKVDFKSKFHNSQKIILVTLLTALLFSSLSVACIFILNYKDISTDDTPPVNNTPTPESTPKKDAFTSSAILVSSENELLDTINNAVTSATITINCDITLTETLFIPAKEITLTSNSNCFFKLIETNDVTTIVVNSRGVLKLDGVIITHVASCRGMGVDVFSGGKLVLSRGEITGNIGGNGGVRVNSGGSFEMSGGKISNNLAPYGGGVYVASRGTFSMYGGVITDNTAAMTGGGVYNSGTFIMYGGEIVNNIANDGRSEGGGVYNSGAFNDQGGVISGNKGNNVHNTRDNNDDGPSGRNGGTSGSGSSIGKGESAEEMATCPMRMTGLSDGQGKNTYF